MNDFAIRVLTAQAGKTHLFSVGQAGFIIKSKSGQLLGIDLYLSECVERVEGHDGFKRLLPRILDPFELEYCGLIATHPHYDHFDMDSIPQMMSNGQTKLFASVECRKEVEKLGMSHDNCIYVVPGDNYQIGDFKLSFLNCDHGSGAPDAVAVIVEVDGKRIVEVGDTCLRLDRIKEYHKNGPIDVLIAPINGAYGNLNEVDCAELANELQPGLTIPCHYAMFASHGGNPGLFRIKMIEKSNKYAFLAMGEKYTF